MGGLVTGPRHFVTVVRDLGETTTDAVCGDCPHGFDSTCHLFETWRSVAWDGYPTEWERVPECVRVGNVRIPVIGSEGGR